MEEEKKAETTETTEITETSADSAKETNKPDAENTPESCESIENSTGIDKAFKIILTALKVIGVSVTYVLVTYFLICVYGARCESWDVRKWVELIIPILVLFALPLMLYIYLHSIIKEKLIVVGIYILIQVAFNVLTEGVGWLRMDYVFEHGSFFANLIFKNISL